MRSSPSSLLKLIAALFGARHIVSFSLTRHLQYPTFVRFLADRLGFMWNKSAGVRFLGRNQNNAFPEFGGSTDLGPASASDAISSNWTHVAFTVSTSSKTSAIFVDGKKDATLQLSAALKSASNVRVLLCTFVLVSWVMQRVSTNLVLSV